MSYLHQYKYLYYAFKNRNFKYDEIQTPQQAAAIYLFNKSSFRFSQNAKADILIVLKTYFKTLFKIFRNKIEVKVKDFNNGVAAFDDNDSSEEFRTTYLKFHDVETSLFIGRNKLNGYVRISHVPLHLFFISLLFFLILPFSFSKNRIVYALLLLEQHELYNLHYLLKQSNINRLYHFSIYEKDANFITIFLQLQKILTTKITSEVPLAFANKIILADEICYNFGYQYEEIIAFKKGIFANKVNYWIPEAMHNYYFIYNDKSFEVKKNVIGFYSSAFWLRTQLNHNIADVGSYKNEEIVLKGISKIIQRHTELRLYIFLHPYERINEIQIQQSELHYKSIFGNLLNERVFIVKTNYPSTHHFFSVNLGISLFSTVAFERLSLGFKTLLIPNYLPDFPIKGSSLENICSHNINQLENNILKNLNSSKEKFFKDLAIQHYVTNRINVNYEILN